MTIHRIVPQQPITENYSKIRSSFLSQTAGGGGGGSQAITDHHGWSLGGSNNFLTDRFAGLDKLFYTLVQGVVDDPDFAARKDSKIYEKMLRDPQIFYCLYVRKAAISSLPWQVRVPAGKEQDSLALSIAEKTENRLRRIPRFSELLDNIQDALLPGISVNELVWQLGEKGEYVVKDHFPVNKDRIKFDKQGRLYLLATQAPSRGILCPPYKFIKHLFNVTDGSWRQPDTGGYTYYGRGLADTPLYHYFYFKMMAMKFMMKELERYGMPFKVFYTGPQNTQLAAKMAEIMAALKNDCVVAIPGKKGDTTVEILNTTRSGNMFALFINYVDSLITKTILGQELMTEMPGVGSYAAAAVHKSVFGIINEQDRLIIRDTLNATLIRYDMQLNYPNVKEEYYPVFDFKKSPVEDVPGFLDTVDKAMSLGLDISARQVREYTGLREPAEGEQLLERPEPVPIPGMPGQPGQPGKPAAQGDKKPKPEKKDKEPKEKKPVQKYELRMQLLKCPNCGKSFEREKILRRTVTRCPACNSELTFDKDINAKLIKPSEQEKDD